MTDNNALRIAQDPLSSPEQLARVARQWPVAVAANPNATAPLLRSLLQDNLGRWLFLYQQVPILNAMSDNPTLPLIRMAEPTFLAGDDDRPLGLDRPLIEGWACQEPGMIQGGGHMLVSKQAVELAVEALAPWPVLRRTFASHCAKSDRLSPYALHCVLRHVVRAHVKRKRRGRPGDIMAAATYIVLADGVQQRWVDRPGMIRWRHPSDDREPVPTPTRVTPGVLAFARPLSMYDAPGGR